MTKTISKGQVTKNSILDLAMQLASTLGISGISIGELAKKAGMSKSGLFAHFESKDILQIDVLKLASERFVAQVLTPSFKVARGEPRIRAMFENWIKWNKNQKQLPGGCIFIAAAIELDDQPGALRDYVKKTQSDLMDAIAHAAQIAIEEGHFKKNVDPKQFAWSMYSFILGYHHFNRLLEDPTAEQRLRNSFEGLIVYAKVYK